MSYKAYAIIGLKIKEEQLFTEQTVKAFDHDFSEEYLFHPRDGRKLWHLKENPKDFYNSNIEVIHIKGRMWNILTSTENQEFYVAMTFTVQDEYNGGKYFVSLKDENLIDQFREDMIELGLWNEENFGLWSVLKYV